MKRISLCMLIVILSLIVIPNSHASNHAARASYLAFPLSFVKNEGQMDPSILFYEQGKGHTTTFTREGISLSLSRSGKIEEKKPLSDLVTLTPVNGVLSAPHALDAREGKINYLMGNDPSKWKTNIPTYGGYPL